MDLQCSLINEFLDYQEGDTEQSKQDCETRAFRRLAARIKGFFPKLLLLLDGFYAKGPVMETLSRLSLGFYDRTQKWLTALRLGGIQQPHSMRGKPLTATNLGRSTTALSVSQLDPLLLRFQWQEVDPNSE